MDESCQVRVNASLLEQVVVSLLQVNSLQIVLSQLSVSKQYFRSYIKLETSLGTLLVSKENQVRNNFELDDSLVRVELFILLLLSLPVSVLG